MSVSPYAVAADAVARHKKESNPHPQYALAADVALQLAGKAKANHTHPSTTQPTVVAASSGSVTVHTHVINEVTGLQAALDAKAPVVHGHAISEVTNLQSALDGKSALGHMHAQSDVTNLVGDLAALITALSGKVPTTRVVDGQDSIQIASGGPDLSADVFLNLVGDDDTPGNSKLYGTNASGVKGWYDQPVGGAASDPAYSPGSFTVANETAKILSRHLKLTGSQRATLAGTATLRIT